MEAHYDDPNFFYTKYWSGRDYEHKSEVIALNNLLQGKKFSTAADIGGGYGRLSAHLAQFCEQVYLVEPSAKQLAEGKKYLKDFKNVTPIKGTSENSKLSKNSLDLVIMVRVSHHLVDLQPSLNHIYDLLKPGGIFIIEIANSANFKERIKSIFTGRPIQPTPVERRSLANIRNQTIAFVNHHPKSVLKSLNKTGFVYKKTLSVSNFRGTLFKKLLPQKLLLGLESLGQKLLGGMYFGPSIWMLLEKPKS